jgi:S1-C subfamily serine protease
VVGRHALLRRASGLVAVALLGAGLALGGAALLGGFDGGTTTVRELPASMPASQSVAPSGARLSVRDLYRRASPGVVQITATSNVQEESDPFFNPFPQDREEQVLGSGFVVDKAGHIVTNYHVVRNAHDVKVSFSNNENVKAIIVGTDPSTDLAVLKVATPSRALTPLPLGDSDAVQVGDPVAAIGNPFGLDRTVTAGIVSALQRAIIAPNGYTIDHAIQTDAPINQGNSGGPLLNAQGQVIGVNSQIETGGGGGNVGIGFAVPSNTVKTVMAQLIRSGRVNRAFMGISALPLTTEIAQEFNLATGKGLLLQSVRAGSGAAKAGLKAGTTQVTVAGETYVLGGDIVVAVDRTPVDSLQRLRDLLAAKKPGDTIQVEFYRGEEKKTVTVTLGRQPSSQR